MSLQIQIFPNNPFWENTVLLSDPKSGNAIIIDPGAYEKEERAAIDDYLETNGLRLERVLLTHAHIDHILGNRYFYEKYGVLPESHALEVEQLRAADVYCDRYGFPPPNSPIPEKLLAEGDSFKIGNAEFQIIFAPGHSPGHVVFYNPEDRLLIGGDVLFRESIGRTDLPGGHHATLLNSIRERIFTLPDDTIVVPGHGPNTTIGHEKQHNPFLK